MFVFFSETHKQLISFSGIFQIYKTLNLSRVTKICDDYYDDEHSKVKHKYYEQKIELR